MDQFIKVSVYILAGILGLCVGSFLNVVIYRVPKKMSLAKPSSHCTSCGYRLRWYDNIPVLSYLMLGGKCRKCRSHISVRYTIVELSNAVLWLLSVWLFWDYSIAFACVVALTFSVLICIFFIDLEHMLIFNRFVAALLILAIVASFVDGYADFLDHLIGLVIGLGSFMIFYFGSIKILKKEGLGFGDVKLAAAAGLLLGWQRFILAMLIASISASVVLLLLKAFRKDENGREYPFAPFITVGMAVSMLFGSQIINWYIDLLVR